MQARTSPLQAAARYRRPVRRSRDFRGLSAKHMQKREKGSARTALWISRAELMITRPHPIRVQSRLRFVHPAMSMREGAQAACKPGSVPGPKAGGWSFLWDPRRREPRATDPGDRPENQPAPNTLAGIGAVAPTWSCSRWGLPCRRRCRRRGALLPHPFTLARRQAEACPGGRSALCGTFPGVAPAGCYPAPCFRGARTFLPRPRAGATIRPPDANL
jgi:hypothetical protein